MKYLVIGAGGTGGMIAAFLAEKNFDVTAVARGNHLKVIQENGLIVKKADGSILHVKNLKALPQEEVKGEIFEVVFVCVKAYGIRDIIPLIESVSDNNTYIIPILNSMETGNVLRSYLPGKTVFDGCIYITGYISAPGEITQNNPIFRIIFGEDGVEAKAFPKAEQLNRELSESGIRAEYSEGIYSKIFEKISFTSAFGAAGVYFGITSKELKSVPEYTMFYRSLLQELQNIQRAAGFKESGDLVESNMKLLMAMDDHFTTSMMKDISHHHADEREQLIFNIIDLAAKYNVEVPQYRKVADFLGYGEYKR